MIYERDRLAYTMLQISLSYNDIQTSAKTAEILRISLSDAYKIERKMYLVVRDELKRMEAE